MGKWTALLAEKISVPPQVATDRTDKRGVLSVLAVTCRGDAREFQASAPQSDADVDQCAETAAKRVGDAVNPADTANRLTPSISPSAALAISHAPGADAADASPACSATENFSAPPQSSTDRTDKSPLLSVLAVTKRGGARKFQSATLTTREQADACHAGGWTDAEIATFIERRDRLLRWNWTDQDAEALAERLTLRDREGDDRRSCTECLHGRASRCPDGFPMPADLLQRCPAFRPRESAQMQAPNRSAS